MKLWEIVLNYQGQMTVFKGDKLIGTYIRDDENDMPLYAVNGDLCPFYAERQTEVLMFKVNLDGGITIYLC